MSAEKVEFPGHSGARLAGRLERPEGGVRAFAVFAHCFTCGKDIAAAQRIARALTEEGIAVLRFDFTGLGHSAGEFANTNFTSNVEDLIAAARFLEGLQTAPTLLIGHSLGGAAVLAATPELAEVRAVVAIAAPSDPGHVKGLLAPVEEEIRARGEARVSLAGRRFTVRRQFLEDLAGQRLLERVSRMRSALLVMHSPTDRVVGIENAAEIFQAAKHPKSFVSLADADHLLSRKADAAYAARVVAAWASRYLPH